MVEKLDKARIQEMLNLVADPENSSIIIRSKSFESVCTLEDPYYGTKHSNEPYSD